MFSRWHHTPPRTQIAYSSEILHKFGWFPASILSLWTILNDDHGDYVLVIPARSLKECPCCALNTQWRDYADPYMWCCGCIPPVRLNPICYRFGLKKREVQQAQGGGWRFVQCCIHALQCIPLLLYHRGSELNLPLEAVFLSVCIRTLKKNLGLCQGCALYFIFSWFSLFFYVLFSLCGWGKPKFLYSFPLNVGPIKHICGFSIWRS